MYVAYDIDVNIEGIIWLRAVVDKLALKHHVETHEVEEVLAGKSKFRLAEKGEREGEDVYVALGQTEAGRYLTVLFVHKTTKEALILSARDMAQKERKLYARK
jgi:uncharacterized DUF497 family protein